jgi:hypothetical protein
MQTRHTRKTHTHVRTRKRTQIQNKDAQTTILDAYTCRHREKHKSSGAIVAPSAYG